MLAVILVIVVGTLRLIGGTLITFFPQLLAQLANRTSETVPRGFSPYPNIRINPSPILPYLNLGDLMGTFVEDAPQLFLGNASVVMNAPSLPDTTL